MLRKIMLGAVLAGSLIIGAQLAIAAGYDWHFSTRNSTDTADVSTDLNISGSFPEILVTNPATRLPEILQMAGAFDVNFDTDQVNVAIIGEDKVNHLELDLAAINASLADKASSASVSSLSSSVSSSLSSISSTLSALGSTTSVLASSSLKRIRVQTDTSGTYTWTFPTAFASGTVPVIMATPEDATAGASTDVRITSISNTSVTVQTSRITTVLGLLSLNATPQIYVHLTAIAP